MKTTNTTAHAESRFARVRAEVAPALFKEGAAEIYTDSIFVFSITTDSGQLCVCAESADERHEFYVPMNAGELEAITAYEPYAKVAADWGWAL